MDIARKFESNADMNFGLTFPVRLIPGQISVNLRLSEKCHNHDFQKIKSPCTLTGHFLYKISCSIDFEALFK